MDARWPTIRTGGHQNDVVGAPSIYTPCAGVDPPEPAWKSFPDFQDAVHPRQQTFRGDTT